ncbi:MAG: 4Fe-4S dicluster domain-containing protein [Acidobacteriota bacterium]|nr:4Fe-4S binding protein [Blastocatellia bacterium]MDW8239109.1 4Fe-4S dicluster domain-containing protein [Acidobacteriota bacterium]
MKNDSTSVITKPVKPRPTCPPAAKTSGQPSAQTLPKGISYHRLRKAVHLICVIIFIALPFFDVMRFDIPRQRFYFAGYELWINEFGIIFFALMFLLFLIAAVSIFYGRFYCGYLCPQLIFSEASIAIEERIRRFINKRFIDLKARQRQRISRALFYLALGVVSVFLAFVFISYFVEPRDLFWRLMSLDIKTAGGIAGATTTLITFLDFTLVRQRFCTSVCPYGYLQGMLSDDNTLIVHYRDENRECIECKKCVRVCEMGIDIRTSPYQIECIHCGECIDACAEVLGKLGKQGLIHYAWGEHGELLQEKKPVWYRRLGLRDAKRVVILLVVLFYGAGLFVALSMRRDVLVRVTPVRTTLYRIGPDGQIQNQFRLTVANRGHHDAMLTLSLVNLPGARLMSTQNPLLVKPGEQSEQEFEIAVPPSMLPPGVNHFQIVAHVAPENVSDAFDLTFITPTGRSLP